MCGIAGYIQRDSKPPALEAMLERPHALDAMMERLARRGPDGAGAWTAASGPWQVALGHRRLSIIDLEGGRQPLGNEDGSVQITYNGELFNFQALRPGLEAQGHRFATRSDTEVIVHLYEQHGVDSLAQLNGMFAFAIWDRPRGELLLARDRAGIKPLYYCQLADGGVAFASELTALLQHPGIARRADLRALAGYFFADYVHPPETAIEGVRKLEPGHWVRWKDGKLTEPRAFWSLQDMLARGSAGGEVDALKRDLWNRLSRAVERQMIADVPLGVFLSGGLDSSTVAAHAQKLARGALKTFSIAFEEPDFDESPYARAVAKHLGTEHVEETLNEKSLLDNLDLALGALDEPMADPSILPTFMLSRLASRHVKVVLGGDAGDELWAGYPTYKAHRVGRIYRHVPEVIQSGVIRPLVASMPVQLTYQSLEWKAKRFALRFDADPVRRHLRWMSNTDLGPLAEAFPGLRGEPGILDWAAVWAQAWAARLPADERLTTFLALDFQTYMPGSVLTKVDRASMANGLEVRPPFLDNEIVDWVFGLPASCKLRGNTSKFLLKMAAEEHLPREIVHRRKKGFAIPLGRWLRGPLKDRLAGIVRSSPLWEGGQVSRETFSRWNEEHQAGRADHSKPLWGLIVFDHWARKEGIRVG